MGRMSLRYAPCVPVKQGSANLIFELGNAPADSRLRPAERNSCFTETAMLGRSHKTTEMAKLDQFKALRHRDRPRWSLREVSCFPKPRPGSHKTPVRSNRALIILPDFKRKTMSGDLDQRHAAKEALSIPKRYLRHTRRASAARYPSVREVCRLRMCHMPSRSRIVLLYHDKSPSLPSDQPLAMLPTGVDFD